MSGYSFRDRYSMMLSRDLKCLQKVLYNVDRYTNWTKNRNPDSTAERDLNYALFLLYAKHTGPEIRAYLERTIEVTDRVLKEKKCESKLCKYSFPMNRGSILRVRAYAKSLCGESVDLSALEQASHDYEAYCKLTGPSDWDEISQPYLLAAIRLALICGNFERAEKLVASRKCTQKQKKEQDMWQAVLSAKCKQGLPIKDNRLMAQYDSIFNRNRNPYEPEGIAALELSLLRERFFSENGEEICWERIIDAVSQ